MSILYVIIPLSLVLMGAAAWALLWAVDSGQFDDIEAHGRMPLGDDPPPDAQHDMDRDSEQRQ